MRKISTLGLGLLLLFSPFLTFAQEEAPTTIIGVSQENAAGNAACFDFYTFGSVKAELAPALPQTVPGATMVFMGSVKNENSYPLTDGKLFVKIYKKSAQFSNLDGDTVIDQFALPEKLTLPAQGEKQTSVNWKVPNNLPSGSYVAAFFFLTEDRFNLLGLPFSDDVTGQRVPFTVTNTEETPLAFFDRSKVSLNNQKYNLVSLPPFFGPQEEVTVKVNLSNPSSETKVIPVSWKEYRWDSLQPENARTNKEERITLQPNETKELSYVVTPKSDAVSYLVVEAKDGETGSVLNIRFARNEVPDTRLNFVGLQTYPLRADQENALVACAHAIGFASVPDTALTLTLKDNAGKIIHEYEYTGEQTGAMGGFKGAFTPKRDYANVTLTAKLIQAGQVKEEVEISYSCEDIDPNICQQIPETKGGALENTTFQKLLIGGAGIVVFLLALLFFRRASNNRRVQFVWFLAFFVSASVILGVNPHSAEAKNVRISGTANLQHSFGNGVSMHGGADYTVDYYADAVNADSLEQIADGSTLSPGTRIKFVPKPRTDNTDIFWNFTGNVFGTPYGYWGGPSNYCEHHIGGGQDVQGQHRSVYLHYIVTPTVTDTNVGGNAGFQDVGADAQGNRIYLVQSAGNISADIRFLPTSSDFVAAITSGGGQSCTGGSAVFPVSLPERTITFNFTVPGGSSNQPPNPPTISGPVAGSPNNTYTFTATATDPDGDQLRYYFDWNSDGVADECSPSDCSPVPSGTARSAARSWSTEGGKSFQVRVRDTYNQYSTWTTYGIVLTNYLNQPPACGPASTTPYSTQPPADQMCNSPAYVDPNSVSQVGYSWRWTCYTPPVQSTCPDFTTGSCAAKGYQHWVDWNPSDEGNPTWAQGPTYCWEGNISIYRWPHSCNAGNPGFSTYCIGPYESGPPSSLKLCEGSCSSGVEIPGNFTMSRGSTRDVVACWNTASACTDGSGNVSAAATWTEGGGNHISLSGTDPKRVNADNSGTESFSASYSGQTANRNVTVACVPTVTCDNAPGRENYCENQSFNVDNGCGTNISCNGTKTCNYNWKEVAP